MGFIHANIIPLLKESKKKQFYGNLLLLGKGDIYFNIEKSHEYAKTSGAIINSNVDIKPSYLKSFADKGYPHCETIFKMLGFSKVSVLDYSGQEAEPCFFTDYTPRMFDAVSYGKMDNKLYITVAIATKVLESTGNKILQQGAYAKKVDWVKNSVNKA